MAYENNDKLTTIESSVARIKKLLDSIYLSDHSLQKRTKARCADLADTLRDMADLLDELSKSNGRKPLLISEASIGADDEYTSVDDLSADNDYTARSILHNYSVRLRMMAQAGLDVVELNRFAGIVSFWFHERYLPERRNPRFHYRADRIREWIDALILCYGVYMQANKCPEFLSKMQDWIVGIGQDSGNVYQIPYFVSSVIGSTDAEDYTCEAIIIERIFKQALYSETFYPSNFHSVEEQVILHHPELADKSLADLIEMSHHALMKMSTFDLLKYEEEAS